MNAAIPLSTCSCSVLSLLQDSFAKETYNFIDSTNQRQCSASVAQPMIFNIGRVSPESKHTWNGV